ncbi:MAG: UDP-N-acetylmuramoyl-L-alanine--D-glutamate ligase [Ferrimicrobium sp.]
MSAVSRVMSVFEPQLEDKPTVVIVGAGTSGMGAIECLRGDATLLVVEDDDERRRVLGLDERVERVLSSAEAVGLRCDLVVVSPGVSLTHPVVAANRDRVIGEVELGSRVAAEPVIAVTGTNGKTTVATLIASMIGEGATLCGNAGVSFAGVAKTHPEVFVVEASSFQLASCQSFSPAVAVWTNFSPDHLDWHGSIEAYREAKASLFVRLAPGSIAVLNADDPVIRATPVPDGVSILWFSLTQDAHATQSGDDLVGPGGVRIPVASIRKSAPHDRANLLAAWLASDAFGVDFDRVREVAQTFGGLAHRLEYLASANRVSWWNDSKATTPASVVAALASFDRVVLIAGGRNKGLSYEPLAQSASTVVGVVGIGESGPEVLDVIARTVDLAPRRLRRAESMASAVDMASAIALEALADSVDRDGDSIAVLLSPGSASYDWYHGYEERGDDFRREVERYIANLEVRQ